MSSTGSPTADSTITMVTRPACGTPAAPIEAAVAVMLKKTCHVYYYREHRNPNTEILFFVTVEVNLKMFV